MNTNIKVQLLDDNEQVIQEVEGSNALTQGMANYISGYGSMPVNAIYLTDADMPTDAKEYKLMGNVLAFASKFSSVGAANRGKKNDVLSYTKGNLIRSVFDFSKGTANGVIKSLSLASTTSALAAFHGASINHLYSYKTITLDTEWVNLEGVTFDKDSKIAVVALSNGSISSSSAYAKSLLFYRVATENFEQNLTPYDNFMKYRTLVARKEIESSPSLKFLFIIGSTVYAYYYNSTGVAVSSIKLRSFTLSDSNVVTEGANYTLGANTGSVYKVERRGSKLYAYNGSGSSSLYVAEYAMPAAGATEFPFVKETKRPYGVNGTDTGSYDTNSAYKIILDDYLYLPSDSNVVGASGYPGVYRISDMQYMGHMLVSGLFETLSRNSSYADALMDFGEFGLFVLKQESSSPYQGYVFEILNKSYGINSRLLLPTPITKTSANSLRIVYDITI